MIEPLKENQRIIAGDRISTDEKVNQLINAVNALEAVVYGCDDDDDCGDDCEETIEAMLDGDLCPDCRFDALLDSLDDLDDDQLQVVRAEANRLLEERSQEGV